MKISSLKCNHIVNPLGFDLSVISLSWKVQAMEGGSQKWSQVEISLSGDFKKIIFASPKAVLNSTNYRPEFLPVPETRYFWRVTVESDTGKCAVSQPAWFESGKGGSWSGVWVASPTSEISLFRRSFEIRGQVSAARLYVCSVGMYEASVNGLDVTREVFAPGFNDYDLWLQYQTYDVTSLLIEGKNVMGIHQGPGWFSMVPRIVPSEAGKYSDQGLAFQAELHIDYADGHREVVASDDRWVTRPSFVTQSSIYDGETIDGRRFLDHWSTPSITEEGWAPAVTRTDFHPNICPRRSVPVTIHERFHPVAVLITPAGDTVLDIGQNMVGWLDFYADFPAGTEITLYFGEFLERGNFCNKNLMEGKQEFHYISDGNGRMVKTHFTFFGFRYVRVEGWVGPLHADSFTASALYSDLPVIGEISTSNKYVNRLFENILWSQKGNFIDTPTDCPQRSERSGWTGDAQVFCSTACYNMDAYPMYSKYMYDLLLGQKRLGGAVPYIVPTMRSEMAGACGWSDAVTIIPWTVYVHTGDPAILEMSFVGMCSWVDWITARCDASGLWMGMEQMGDWLALDGDGKDMCGGTDKDYLANCYYLISMSITVKTARVLGREAEAQKYALLYGKVLQHFQNEFFTPSGRPAVNTQTAAVYALLFSLAPENAVETVRTALAKLLERNGGHLTTGFLGTPYLCKTLSEYGMNEDAYRMLVDTEPPSWLYPVTMGATSIWENWLAIAPDGLMHGSYSLNHYAYGAIASWMYEYMLGIRPMEENPGFRSFILAPRPNRHLTFARGSCNTVAGIISSEWALRGEKIIYNFGIPFDTIAHVSLPDFSLETVLVNGKDPGKCCIEFSMDGTNGVCTLSAGKYTISYIPTKSYRLTYGLWSRVGDIRENPEALACFHRVADSRLLPEVAELCFQEDSASLQEALQGIGGPKDWDVIRTLEAELSKIPYPEDSTYYRSFM